MDTRALRSGLPHRFGDRILRRGVGKRLGFLAGDPGGVRNTSSILAKITKTQNNHKNLLWVPNSLQRTIEMKLGRAKSYSEIHSSV